MLGTWRAALIQKEGPLFIRTFGLFFKTFLRIASINIFDRQFGEISPQEAKLKYSAQYLKSELPVRYAHMISVCSRAPFAGSNL